MKIKPKHFESLSLAIKTLSPVYKEYRAYKNVGHSDMRWRWDCLWSTPKAFRNEWFSEIYSYANDDHVDTALRKITGTK